MRVFGRAQELCEGRCGRPGLPVPNSPYGLCGRKATLKNRVQELCEGRCGRPGLPVPNSPYGLCGRKAALNLNWEAEEELEIVSVNIIIELMSFVRVEVIVLGDPL